MLALTEEVSIDQEEEKTRRNRSSYKFFVSRGCAGARALSDAPCSLSLEIGRGKVDAENGQFLPKIPDNFQRFEADPNWAAGQSGALVNGGTELERFPGSDSRAPTQCTSPPVITG